MTQERFFILKSSYKKYKNDDVQQSIPLEMDQIPAGRQKNILAVTSDARQNSREKHHVAKLICSNTANSSSSAC
ncbi:MAG: hypothetical protein E6Q59_04970 [Nitrosomonas sp.]|nr:MAG: hypothetical protein E6Q59_04970 [Nitrosomonas sp.]